VDVVHDSGERRRFRRLLPGRLRLLFFKRSSCAANIRADQVSNSEYSTNSSSDTGWNVDRQNIQNGPFYKIIGIKKWQIGQRLKIDAMHHLRAKSCICIYFFLQRLHREPCIASANCSAENLPPCSFFLRMKENSTVVLAGIELTEVFEE